ncbi:3-mercaptopyruvate sulfurtransferase [Xaviernesmea oryzae]|uniref:3-mercaptopyruvate sulfurtransferase n=1 Tax=Xaviernesmea oryzae TaxID=464029 RepID=A0A1Q9AWR8_9HYPH|nr:3-mercaptopyruvate sulfurtransferase [Xaviernesmea oryzae]OLP59891.1 3-mercaptopyruvate sulfurtransferase [Xaviernesmea oryzae]SEK46956.1 thiosulfate/3-mercaptopyruvate sulfurtransferase [Xaviernesmea oryzae]
MSASSSPSQPVCHVVSFDWLQARLETPGIKVVDASWYLPAHKRDPKAEFAAGHIPGAVFFDQDAISDPTSGLPHTLPAPDAFAAAVGALGLSETDTIIVYDGPGFFSAPRAWWMLKVMGAQSVFVLDGGFDAWKAEGRPVTEASADVAPAVFTPAFDAKAVTSLDEMRAIVSSAARQIADARSAGRFTGEEPEPRAGMRSGHMPGAHNLPIGQLTEGGKLKSPEGLRQTFSQAGIDLGSPVVTSCGSGVTAAVISLALSTLGHRDHTLYDGSWAEWGSRDDTDVVTGKE